MDRFESADAILDRAACLHEQGLTEQATILMSELICATRDSDVRAHASRLFSLYRGQKDARTIEVPDKMTTPPTTSLAPRANTAPTVPSPACAASEKPLAQDFLRLAKERRERRMQDISIPAGAELPASLHDFILQYMHITARSFEMPSDIILTLGAIERGIERLGAMRTQLDIIALVQQVASKFTQTPVGIDVLHVLLHTLYTHDFLGTEQVQILFITLHVPTGTKGRTIRELLEADE